ncbi:MAG TPA: carotenoid oxygenase family protein [Acetobacteraceae bacterium]|nr:carotenoid oxygenase family protein [Acetobacteraceae bacterium]
MPDELPPFLSGNYAPIFMEADAPHLPVLGELPHGLRGTLFRNGPNPQFMPADPARHHWFLGDGMIHAFMLEDGRARYRNRWVRTPKFVAEGAAGGPGPGDWSPDEGGVANTNIVWHAGRLLALEEAHPPIALDPSTLATLGQERFGGALSGPFTAHPKTDPETGEMVFFGYSASGPLSAAMSYGTIDRAGRLTRFERFEAPYCSMVHDFAVTARHVVFPVLPLSGSMKRAMAGGAPFAWEPALGAYVGVIRRDQGIASLRWFRAEACYVFHIMNAWDADGSILADVLQYQEPPLFPRADGGAPHATPARLTRWTIRPDVGTDAFKSIPLDDLDGEFPRIDDRRAGLANRYGAMAARSAPDGEFDAIAWYDFRSGARALHSLPPGDAVSEPVFVPRAPDAAEGDGWLLAVVWRGAERRSDLIVLDTADIAARPLATVQLSHRVPFGFHGNFVASEDLPCSA